MKNQCFTAPEEHWSKEMKMQKLLELIIKQSYIEHDLYPEDFIKYMMDNIVDDKDEMYGKLNERYGKKGIIFHRECKEFYKILADIKRE